MQVVLSHSRADSALETQLHDVRGSILAVDEVLNGNRSRQEPGEKTRPIIQDRLFSVSLGVARSTYGPTPTHRESLDIAQRQIDEVRVQVEGVRQQVSDLGRALVDAGAPWLEGGVEVPID
jgi:hypothetical protein